MLASVMGFVGSAWAAYSFWATIGGALGLACILGAVFGWSILPGFIRRPLIWSGMAIIALATVYQAGSTHGAQAAFLRQQRLAQAAEATRVVIASRVTQSQIDRAARDLAAEKTQNLELRKLLDASRKDPHAARVCVDRDLARRLRNL